MPDTTCYVETTQTIWPPKSACAVQCYCTILSARKSLHLASYLKLHFDNK